MCQQIIVRKFGACGHTAEVPDDRVSMCLFGEHCSAVGHTHRSFQQRQNQFCPDCKRREAAVRFAAKTGKLLNIQKAPSANDKTSAIRKNTAPLSPSMKTKLKGVALDELRAYLATDLSFNECKTLVHFALQQPSFVSKESIVDVFGEGAGGWYTTEADKQLVAISAKKGQSLGKRMQKALARGRALRESKSREAQKPETPKPVEFTDAPKPQKTAWSTGAQTSKKEVQEPEMPVPEPEVTEEPKPAWVIRVEKTMVDWTPEHREYMMLFYADIFNGTDYWSPDCRPEPRKVEAPEPEAPEPEAPKSEVAEAPKLSWADMVEEELDECAAPEPAKPEVTEAPKLSWADMVEEELYECAAPEPAKPEEPKPEPKITKAPMPLWSDILKQDERRRQEAQRLEAPKPEVASGGQGGQRKKKNSRGKRKNASGKNKRAG